MFKEANEYISAYSVTSVSATFNAILFSFSQNERSLKYLFGFFVNFGNCVLKM